MIDLLKSDGALLWHTHDYKLKFKRFVIRFDVDNKINPLTKDTWVYNCQVEFGKHKFDGLDGGYKLFDLQNKINMKIKEFIKEYYKDFL